jgi:hypothetical protein
MKTLVEGVVLNIIEKVIPTSTVRKAGNIQMDNEERIRKKEMKSKSWEESWLMDQLMTKMESMKVELSSGEWKEHDLLDGWMNEITEVEEKTKLRMRMKQWQLLMN